MLWWTLWQLKSQLKSQNAGLRKQAVEKLGELKDTRAVKPLIAALADSDTDVQKSAVEGLVRIGKVAEQPLIIALKSRHPFVRKCAAEALGEIGGVRAVEPLVAALNDLYSPEVRKNAAEALVKIGKAAVKPLIAALKHSYYRNEAAEVLGRIGDARAVEPLIAVLKEPYSSATKNAAEALIKFGESAVEPLIATLKSSYSNVQKYVVEALGEIGDASAVEPLITALKDRDSNVRQGAANALGRVGDARSVKPLIAALEDGDTDVRKNAAVALVRTGEAAVEPLITALESPDSDVQKYVVEALGEIGDARAVEPLIATLKDRDSDVRERAANALGKIGDARAVEPLVVALEDEAWSVRKQAVRTLQSLRWIPEGDEQCALLAIALGYWKTKFGTAAVEPLIAALKEASEEGESFVQWEAADALKEIGGAAIEPLIAVLGDSNSEVRKQAAEILLSLNWKPEDDEQHALLAIALGEWEKAVKLGAAAVEPLITALKDKICDDRGGAASALGQIGDARAVEPLVAALKENYHGLREENVREEAAEALVRIGGVAVEPLMAVLKDADSNARARAASALGQIGDARAVELLVAVLKDNDYKVRRAAAAALSSLNWQPTDEAQRVTFAIASLCWVTIVQLGAIAVEPLIAAIEDLHLTYEQRGAILALGSIGDPRAVGPLVTLAHDNWVAITAVDALRELLESSAQSSSEADLRAAAALYNVSQFQHHDLCGNAVETTIDCSHVRQLARQELIRRGLKA